MSWRVVRVVVNDDVGFQLVWIERGGAVKDGGDPLFAWSREGLRENITDMLTAFNRKDMYLTKPEYREVGKVSSGSENNG